MKSYCTYVTGPIVTGPDELDGPIEEAAKTLVASPVVSGFITLHWSPDLIILFERATTTVCILQNDINEGIVP